MAATRAFHAAERRSPEHAASASAALGGTKKTSSPSRIVRPGRGPFAGALGGGGKGSGSGRGGGRASGRGRGNTSNGNRGSGNGFLFFGTVDVPPAAAPGDSLCRNRLGFSRAQAAARDYGTLENHPGAGFAKNPGAVWCSAVASDAQAGVPSDVRLVLPSPVCLLPGCTRHCSLSPLRLLSSSPPPLRLDSIHTPGSAPPGSVLFITV